MKIYLLGVLILKEYFSLLLPTIKTFCCYEFCLLHMLAFCSLEFRTICYLMTRGDLSLNMLETVFAQHIHTYVIVFRNCFLEMDIFCIPSHHYVHICIHSMIIIFTITIIQQMQKIRFEEVRKIKHNFSCFLCLFVVVVVSGD